MHPYHLKINHKNQKQATNFKSIESQKITWVILTIISTSILMIGLTQLDFHRDTTKKKNSGDQLYIQLNDNRLDLKNINPNPNSNTDTNEENASINLMDSRNPTNAKNIALEDPQNQKSNGLMDWHDEGLLKKLNIESFKNTKTIQSPYFNQKNETYTSDNDLVKKSTESDDTLIKAPLFEEDNNHKKNDKLNHSKAAIKQIKENNENTLNSYTEKTNQELGISENLNIEKASLRVENQAQLNQLNQLNQLKEKNNSNNTLLNSGFETNRLNQNGQNIRNYSSSETKKNNLSEYELKAGSFIFAMLNHQITSDIKGDISAIVTQDVFDSTKGIHLIIPKGTQINGSYENQVSFGQNRLAVTWHRLIFSDGAVFNLGNMAGSDGAGNQGLKDLANHHYLKTFAGAVLSSILSAGVNQQNRSSWLENGKNNLSNQVLEKTSNAAQSLIDKSLESQSTLVIRPGYRFTIKVNQDLNLK